MAVFAKIVDFYESKTKKGYFPVVLFETEKGKEIRSVYSVEEKEPHCEIGSEEMICYDPENPMFFYFANREDELTQDYFKFLFFGGIIAVMLLFIKLAG